MQTINKFNFAGKEQLSVWTSMFPWMKMVKLRTTPVFAVRFLP